MSAPILDFATLAPERPKVKIDGRLYELSVLGDFGLLQQSRIARLLSEIAEVEKVVNARPEPEPTGNADVDAALKALDAIPEVAAVRVTALLEEIVEVILRAPEDVRARLSEVQQRQLVEAFTPTVMAGTAPATNPPANRAARRTSVASSRSSRPRTASRTG